MSAVESCGIVCPLDWIPLPIEPDGKMSGWAETVAEKLCEQNHSAGYSVSPETIRDDLLKRASDSCGREPFYAFALYPDGFETAVAILEVDLIEPDASVPRISLEWLAETFSTDDFGPPHISRTEIPIGPAVRIRQNFATGSVTAGEPGVLLETVMYGVIPDGSESAVVLLVSWTVPGIAEVLEEVVDGVARTLSVELATS